MPRDLAESFDDGRVTNMPAPPEQEARTILRQGVVLSTNVVRYGALSNTGNCDDWLVPHLCWEGRGGPARKRTVAKPPPIPAVFSKDIIPSRFKQALRLRDVTFIPLGLTYSQTATFLIVSAV